MLGGMAPGVRGGPLAALLPLLLLGAPAILLPVGSGCRAPNVGAPPPPAAVPDPVRGRVAMQRVETVGPYLDAVFRPLGPERETAAEAPPHRFYFPADATCRDLLRGDRPLRYQRVGSFGRVHDDAGRACSPVGISTLGRWRDLQAERRPARPPRVLAEFRPVAAGEPWLLVRGRFPLARAIRWPAPMDSVAVLPREPACEAARRAGRATLEYRADDARPFWLETDAGRCPIEGFAFPPATPEESAPPAPAPDPVPGGREEDPS